MIPQTAKVRYRLTLDPGTEDGAHHKRTRAPGCGHAHHTLGAVAHTHPSVMMAQGHRVYAQVPCSAIDMRVIHVLQVLKLQCHSEAASIMCCNYRIKIE